MVRNRKNLYLDIDGVVLTRGGMASAHLDNFLKYVLVNYNVYWLSTRCKGNSKYTVTYLSKFVDESTVKLLRMVRATDFRLDKTEAIDFRKEFFWLDDDLFDSEIKVLEKYNELHSWIKINLVDNPDQLRDLIRTKLKNRKLH